MAVIDELNSASDRDQWGGRGDRSRRRKGEDESEPGLVVLCRNHEVDVPGKPYLSRLSITYREDGPGGNTNLIFDPQNGRWLSAYSTLAGLVRPCAGGVTPWNTWIRCEETGVDEHGWSFEVGTFSGNPKPIYDMGRFSHEALMVDPRTGYVYETEDGGDTSEHAALSAL